MILLLKRIANSIGLGYVAFFIALTLSCFLLAPGVWWGDSLNAYIQSLTGVYGTAQPVLLALLCSLSRLICIGSLPIFVFCITLYFLGFQWMAFDHVQNKKWAFVLFFLLSFCPILFANIGVVQTESLQLSVLAVFIPLVIRFQSYSGSRKLLYFLLLSFLITLFSLLRYDSVVVSIILMYWLSYTFTKKHKLKTVFVTISIFLVFLFSRSCLDTYAGISAEAKSQMSSALLVSDIAGISVLVDVNYVPDYCWQDYLSPSEKSIAKIKFGFESDRWKYSFFSYIFNVDPTVGLFTYDITEHNSDLYKTWMATVLKHPFYYLKFHAISFWYFLFGDNYNLGIYCGLKDSHCTLAVLTVAENDTVHQFIEKYKGRFIYTGGKILLSQDQVPITAAEEKDLLALVSNRRYTDVEWMKWYSAIPSKTYVDTNPIADNYLLPFFEFFKKFRLFCFIISYLLGLVFILLFFRNRFKDSFQKFTFTTLCFAGIVHLCSRFFFITDPVYRFGLISVLLFFFAFFLLFSKKALSTSK